MMRIRFWEKIIDGFERRKVEIDLGELGSLGVKEN